MALLALAPACADHPEGDAAPAARSADPDAPRERHEFALEGVSIGGAPTGEERVSLAAARLVCRKRTGLAGLVTYHDMGELLLVDAALSIDLESEQDSVFASIGRHASRSLPAEPYLRALSGAPRTSRFVTRAVYEGLSIRLTRSGGPVLSLSSKRARLDLDSDTLVLEGGFELVLPKGRKLDGPVAVFSPEHDGIYLPLGHGVGTDRIDHTAYLVLDARGDLSPEAPVPVIAYEDPLESREQELLAHFLERVPGDLEPLLFSALAHARSVAGAAGRGAEP